MEDVFPDRHRLRMPGQRRQAEEEVEEDSEEQPRTDEEEHEDNEVSVASIELTIDLAIGDVPSIVIMEPEEDNDEEAEVIDVLKEPSKMDETSCNDREAERPDGVENSVNEKGAENVKLLQSKQEESVEDEREGREIAEEKDKSEVEESAAAECERGEPDGTEDTGSGDELMLVPNITLVNRACCHQPK